MPELRWQFLMFHPAMTDDKLRDVMALYEPVTISRDGSQGQVCFNGGDYDEESAMRDKFDAWRRKYDQNAAAENPPEPFDYVSYLRSIGVDDPNHIEIPMTYHRAGKPSEYCRIKVKCDTSGSRWTPAEK